MEMGSDYPASRAEVMIYAEQLLIGHPATAAPLSIPEAPHTPPMHRRLGKLQPAFRNRKSLHTCLGKQLSVAIVGG